MAHTACSACATVCTRMDLLRILPELHAQAQLAFTSFTAEVQKWFGVRFFLVYCPLDTGKKGFHASLAGVFGLLSVGHGLKGFHASLGRGITWILPSGLH